jgi:hypothetical protein
MRARRSSSCVSLNSLVAPTGQLSFLTEGVDGWSSGG